MSPAPSPWEFNAGLRRQSLSACISWSRTTTVSDWTTTIRPTGQLDDRKHRPGEPEICGSGHIDVSVPSGLRVPGYSLLWACQFNGSGDGCSVSVGLTGSRRAETESPTSSRRGLDSASGVTSIRQFPRINHDRANRGLGHWPVQGLPRLRLFGSQALPVGRPARGDAADPVCLRVSRKFSQIGTAGAFHQQLFIPKSLFQ